MPTHDLNLIWIDLEMTGLNPDQDVILEIATVVTDSQLNVLAEGPVLAIHQSDAVLANMNSWCVEQHQKSGLTDRVKASQISVAEAEAQTLAFLKEWVDAGKSPMCGNSICMDKRFLYRYMPVLNNYFHYRLLDVSTLKEIVKRWYGKGEETFKKENKHLALSDIYDSIEELKFYQRLYLKPLNEVKA